MRLSARCAALLVAALLVLSACTSSGGSSKYFTFNGALTAPKLIPVADRKPAANFTGSLLSGSGTYDLSKDAAGKVTVVNFWGAWCYPCQVETPQFQSVYQQYRDKGATFVGIDIKEASRGKPRAFVTQFKITYPIVYDDQGRTAVTLGNTPTQAAPFTIVLDKHHKVAGVYLQRIAPQDLTTILTALTAEK